MIPSSVRKLRSLLERSESNATETASPNEAWVRATFMLLLGYETRRRFVLNFLQPIDDQPVEPEARLAAGDEAEMSAMIDGDQPKARIPLERRMIVGGKWHQRIVFGGYDQRGHANPL